MIWKILNLLEKVQDKGHGRFVACCPAHEDSDPSLALTETRDGRILIHCFAGCSPQDILESVGLTMSDLFPEGGLGDFKGWEQLKAEQEGRLKQKKEEKISPEKTVLELAAGMRRKGERLSPKDLERERQAYMRIRNAHS